MLLFTLTLKYQKGKVKKKILFKNLIKEKKIRNKPNQGGERLMHKNYETLIKETEYDSKEMKRHSLGLV